MIFNMINVVDIVDGSDLTICTFITTFSMIPIIAFPTIDDRLSGYLILVISPTIEAHIISDELLYFILFIN